MVNPRLVLILTITAAVLLTYRVLQDFSVNQHISSPDQVINVPCPLQLQACRIRVGDLALALSLSPRGLPALTTLSLQIKPLEPLLSPLTQFEAWFEGRDMEMGKHYFKQTFGQKSGQEASVPETPSNKNTIHATAMIPACSIDPMMIWRLNIEFVHQDKRSRLRFEMSSGT